MNRIKLTPYFNKGFGGGDITVDESLSTNSRNPVSNQAITNKFNQVDKEMATKLDAADLSEFALTADVDSKLALKADKTELEGLVTGVEVDEKITGANFVKPETLDQYETTAATDEKLALKADKAEITDFITAAALEPYAKTEALTTKADKSELTPLATKEEVTTGLAKKLDNDSVNFVKSVKVAGATMTITHGDGSVTTEALPEAGEPVTIDAYTKEETDNKLALKADKTQLETLATKAEIANFITDEDVTGKGYITSAALTGYAKTTDIDTKLEKKADKTELASLATKSEIAGFVNEETVDQKIAAADFVKPATLSNYATTEALNLKADKSQLSNLATKDEIAGFVTDTQVVEKGYITEAALTGYAKSSELTGLATKEELAGKADSSVLSDYVTTESLNGKNYITRGSLDLTLQNYTKNVAVNGSVMTSTMGTGEQVTQELPFYTETEMNEKLAGKADATALANKADKSELTTLATKEEIKPFVKSVTKEGNTVTVTKGDGTSNTFDVGGGAAAGVTSINGQTGEVTLEIPTDNNQLANGAGYATTAYVDEKIGAINAQLDLINGEVK